MHVVLTGTYNSGNKGDAAMELSAAQGIARRYSGSRVTILSPFPEMDGPFYAPLEVASCNRRNLIAGTMDLLCGLLWRLSRLVDRRGWSWLLGPGMRLVQKSDLVIDLSGDMLTEDYGPHVAYSHYIPILKALVLDRPYYLCAQSIGPFKLTLPLARMLLNKAAAITVRDRISLDYLRTIGVRNLQLEQTADLAFLLAPAEPSRVSEILGAEGFVDDGRPILGISVSQLVQAKYRAKNPSAADMDFLDLMAELIGNFARRHDLQVLFVSHVTGPSTAKNDRVPSQAVCKRLNERYGLTARALLGDYRPDELKGIIARCALFCGARMHANIAALSSHVPTVAISYSHKTPGIMALCGLADFVAPIETMTLQTLDELLERAWRTREQLGLSLREKIGQVRTSAELNINKASLLAGGSQ